MATETHGIKPDYMDLSADPGVDFNRFANGGWIDRTQIPSEYPRWGSFVMLAQTTQEKVRALLEESASNDKAVAGSPEQKTGDFYFAGMNEAQVESDGAKPLAGELGRIEAVRSLRGLAIEVARLQLIGVNALFGFGSSTDYDNSSQVIARADQGGLGLSDRDYYLLDAHAAIREKYVVHVTNMFVLLGERAKLARKHARAVMTIETALANASMSKADCRNPDKIMHKMSVDEFQQIIPALPLRRFFKQLGCPEFDNLNVAQPEFFKALNELLGTVCMRDLRVYLRWHLIHAMASSLSSNFVNENFDFYGKKMLGTKVLQSRWKRIVGAVNGALGEIVGQVYVQRYFPPEAKARMLELVGNLRAALQETLTELTWMSEATKQNALKKLEAFEDMIGYPDKWRDYTSLVIDRKSHIGNVLRAAWFASNRDLAKIGQPVDRTEWGMTPQTVNAYYRATANQIVFPAAILQPPFFDLFADDAANYGGIGVVIGHEITHGFDDKGRKFDARGNLNNWWTDEDQSNFGQRIALIKNQYDGFTVSGGKHVNGALVIGEAVADLGGVKLAYRALQKALAASGRTTDANGYTDEQRFFIAFAQIWASRSTPEFEQHQVTNDPHPPARFRVNGTLAHVAEFQKAFGLSDTAPIMLPPDKRGQVW